MQEQLYHPLQEEAAGLGESDDESNMDGNIEAIRQGNTNIHVASQVSNVENLQKVEPSTDPTNIEVAATGNAQPQPSSAQGMRLNQSPIVTGT